MRVMIILGMMVLLSSLAFADLSDYPEPFASDGDVDAIIVVGDKAPASHVIAQTNIALSLSSEAGVQAFGVSKLSSEVTNLNQHIISIGNPCENSISAQILGNPTDCDEDYARGKASIRLIKSGRYTHIIAAGASDEGTLKAANALRNFKSSDLEGEIYELTVDEPVEEKVEAEVEAKIETPIVEVDVTAEAEVAVEQTAVVEPSQVDASEQTEVNTQVSTPQEEPSAIARFFSWIRSWFG